MAVPRLEQGQANDAAVVHIVRHPVAVVRSLVGTGFFDLQDNAYSRFMRLNFDVRGEPIDDAMRWYVEWNLRCEMLSKNVFRVEELADFKSEFTACLGRRYKGAEIKVGKVSTTFNHRARAAIGVVDLSVRPSFNRFVAAAKRYGYSI
jgi:hypothetical protein